MNQRYTPDVVQEVYGSLQQDPLGQVREVTRLNDSSRTDIANFVLRAHEKNIQVCYAMNSPTITKHQLTLKFHEVMEFIGWLENIGIDNVIVSSSALANFLDNVGTKFGIIGSTVMNVRNITRAKNHAMLDRLCPATDRNRDIDFLIKLSSEVEIELLANEMCLFMCPWREDHYVQESLAKFFGEQEIVGDLKDFPIDLCWDRFRFHPEDILKAKWIRPEDVHIYEARGIEWIKLSGRTMPTEWICRVVKAYLSRNYEGNLLDLFPVVSGALSKEKGGQTRFYIDNKFHGNDNFGANLIIADSGRCIKGCEERKCLYCKIKWGYLIQNEIAVVKK
jgi:collagenase-like PrtC family protease